MTADGYDIQEQAIALPETGSSKVVILMWRFGARFQATSGEPATPLIGSTYNSDLDVYQPQYGQTNSLRKEAAHQLDLRVESRVEARRLAPVRLSRRQQRLQSPSSHQLQLRLQLRPARCDHHVPDFPALGVRGTF